MDGTRKEIQEKIVRMLEMLTREELVSMLKIIIVMIGKHPKERKCSDTKEM